MILDEAHQLEVIATERVGISSAIFASTHCIPGCPITSITSTKRTPTARISSPEKAFDAQFR
jgi:hypothetical protein